MSCNLINNLAYVIERFREFGVSIYTVQDAVIIGNQTAERVFTAPNKRHWYTRRTADVTRWNAQSLVASALGTKPDKLNFRETEFRDLLLQAGNAVGEC